MAVVSPEARARARIRDRERKREAYVADPVKFRNRTHARRAEHGDRIQQQRRARYAADSPRFRAEKQRSRERNRDADRAASLRWPRSHPGKAWARYQRRRGAPATPEAIAYVEQIWHDPCAYCGRRTARMVIDHIVPVTGGGLSAAENLTRACMRCNDRKRDRHLFIFLADLGQPTKRENPSAYVRRKRKEPR